MHAQSWAVLAPNRTIHKGQSAYVWVRSGAGALRTAHLRVALHQWTNRGWYAISIHRADRAGRAAFSIVPRRTTAYRVAVVGAGRIATGFSRPVRVTVAGARGHAVVAYAARYRGTPYRYGGAGPRGFDCSGFTQYVFRQFGRALPHSATAQSRYGVRVARAAAVPGDLILFGHRGRYYHAAIYAGRGFMWDASTYGNPVAKRKIYSPRFVVRRVI